MNEPLDYRPSWYRAACCGSCTQGRAECKTPDACRLSDEEQEENRAGMQMLAYLVVIGVVVTSALLIALIN